VVSGIVKQHDGWVDVDDAAQGGTVFRVFLPA
jgi:nitrogen-specific signal transduction histidine kinase